MFFISTPYHHTKPTNVLYGVFIILILAASIAVFSIFMKGERKPNDIPITFPAGVVYMGGAVLSVDVANTPEARIRGLSGRKTLPAGRGMLFIFDSTARHGMWMKEMNFPIDIIWVGENFRIVSIMKHATPQSYPQVFRPSQGARYVIEVPSGFSAEHKIKLDDPVSFEL